MAKAKKENIEDTSFIFGTMEDTNNFAIFQQKNKLYVFHWCGKTEKGEWFRKTAGWDTEKPHCELCETVAPEKFIALIKLNESGI